MTQKVLLTATVQSHICQFHKPLVKLLHEHGYEVHVAARNNLAEKNGLKLDFADKVFDIPFDRSPFSPKNIGAYKMLAKVLQENKYDIIHTNTPVGGIVTRLAANKYRRKNGTKVFYTAHGFHFYKGAPVQNWLIYYPIEKFMSHFTDKLVTITEEDYNLAAKKLHCQVIHTHGVGANSSKFSPFSEEEIKNTRKEFGYDEDTKIIVNVGELLTNKNQVLAIKALKSVIKEYPKCKLLIAGNGPLLDTLKQAVKDNHVEGHVEFLGYTTQVNKYYNIADCVVACSFREGLPLNVMEAMLCGKAVVASNNRGHRELVKDGITGFITDANDYETFASKIIEVLDYPEKYTENALEAVKPFTDKNIEKELYSLYFED